jgi:hypothetical protein
VYLFLVVLGTPTYPKANIPLVPSKGHPVDENAPNPLADAAPLVIIIGMASNPYLN